ncbi:DUF3263 domain-containing protein, partial [Streptomyces sp. NPDC001500]
MSLAARKPSRPRAGGLWARRLCHDGSAGSSSAVFAVRARRVPWRRRTSAPPASREDDRDAQLLNALLDDPRALAHDPVTVNRLRRVREAR